MTIEKSKIKTEDFGKQPLRLKCYVGECLCYGEKEVTQKQKKVVSVMTTPVVTQMLVGEKNNIHRWMWLSCVPNQPSRWLQP
jgi:hypothetical protein